MFSWLDPESFQRLLGELSTRPGERVDFFTENSAELRLEAGHEDDGTPRIAFDDGFALRLAGDGGALLRSAAPIQEGAVRELYRQLAEELGAEPFFRKARRFGSKPTSIDPPPPAESEAELEREARAVLHRLRAHATQHRVGLIRARIVVVRRLRGLLSRDRPWRQWWGREIHVSAQLKKRDRTAHLQAGGKSYDSSLDGYLRRMIAANFPDEAPRPVPSQTPLVALFAEGTAATFFHEILGHLLEADALSEGLSPLLPVLGTTVAPPTLTVWDDPTRTDLAGEMPIDDEGSPARPQPLLDQGRIGVPLGDLGHVDFGQPGRARRATWADSPLPRMTNVVIEPGRADLDSMLRTVARGLLVTSLGSGSVDPSSGRFSLRVTTGRFIRKGELGDPCAPTWLAGDLFPVLETVRPEIGEDLAVDHGATVCTRKGQSLPVGGLAPLVAVPGLVSAPSER